MIGVANSDLISSKRKAINALFPYAILLEQGGQQGVINAILRAARVASSKPSIHGKFMWHHVVLYVSRLFEKRSPTSLNRVIALISPYLPWESALNNKVAVTRWAAAASATPYTEEIGQSVVDVLLQIALIDFLRPHIPIEIWGWLKRQPSLPPMYHGLSDGTRVPTLTYVRRLRDVDLLKSYFLLVWTDQWIFHPDHILEVESSIKQNFGGVGMEHHRKELIDQIERVLERLDRRSESTFKRDAETQYTKFRDLLLEMDKQ